MILFSQSALSGLDIALWDIKGKRLGVPVWQLLGGKVRDRIKVYGWIGGDHPSAVVSAAVERKAQGFTAVKMNGTGKDLRKEKAYARQCYGFESSDCTMLYSYIQLLYFLETNY